VSQWGFLVDVRTFYGGGANVPGSCLEQNSEEKNRRNGGHNTLLVDAEYIDLDKAMVCRWAISNYINTKLNPHKV